LGLEDPVPSSVKPSETRVGIGPTLCSFANRIAHPELRAVWVRTLTLPKAHGPGAGSGSRTRLSDLASPCLTGRPYLQSGARYGTRTRTRWLEASHAAVEHQARLELVAGIEPAKTYIPSRAAASD
jgi:hypothetical protein